MKKFAVLMWTCLLLGFWQMASAQEATNRKISAPNTLSSDREQDGLHGSVRRVRTETAKIILKEGKQIEGPRIVGGITTYDSNGRKIDTVAHPVEGSAPFGKEQYRYDEKGNIIEMVLRGEDGSILSKEIYQYEFDELGNWKKMTTSLAVYEEGKLSFEPVEVTYRTITYYYSQAIDKIAKRASKASSPTSPSASPVPAKSVSVIATPAGASAVDTANDKDATIPRVATGGTSSADTNTDKANPPLVSPTGASDETRTAAVPKSGAPPPKSDKANPPLVSPTGASDETRNAAVAKTDESPLKSDTTKGNPPLVSPTAASDEARNAGVPKSETPPPKPDKATPPLVSPTAASDETRNAGVPKSETPPPKPDKGTPPLVSPTGALDETRNAAAPKMGESAPKSETVASPASTSAANLYEKGSSYLNAGRYMEAAEALREAVNRNPEDALAYVKLGLAYSALSQYKEAVVVLKMAIRINVQVVDPEAYYRLGEAYTGLGKHSEALKAFKQAMYVAKAQVLESDSSKHPRFPTLPDLHYGLGLAYQNTGRYREAINEFKQALELKPDLAEALYGMALAHIGLEDRKSAEQEEKMLRPLNAELADKVAAAINTGTTSPPGFSQGGLRRRP